MGDITTELVAPKLEKIQGSVYSVLKVLLRSWTPALCSMRLESCEHTCKQTAACCKTKDRQGVASGPNSSPCPSDRLHYSKTLGKNQKNQKNQRRPEKKPKKPQEKTKKPKKPKFPGTIASHGLLSRRPQVLGRGGGNGLGKAWRDLDSRVTPLAKKSSQTCGKQKPKKLNKTRKNKKPFGKQNKNIKKSSNYVKPQLAVKASPPGIPQDFPPAPFSGLGGSLPASCGQPQLLKILFFLSLVFFQVFLGFLCFFVFYFFLLVFC